MKKKSNRILEIIAKCNKSVKLKQRVLKEAKPGTNCRTAVDIIKQFPK